MKDDVNKIVKSIINKSEKSKNFISSKVRVTNITKEISRSKYMPIALYVKNRRIILTLEFIEEE